MATRRNRFRLVFLVAAVLLTLVPGVLATPAAQARDVSGNTYTSPHFGYSITWDSSWIVVLESSVEDDMVMMTNGIAVVILIGTESFGADAMSAATVQATVLGFSEGTSNYVVEEQGGDTDRYQMIVSMTITESGQTIDMTMLLEGRAIPSLQATVLFMGMVETDLFDSARPALDAFLSTLTLPGGASEESAKGLAVSEPELVKGEEAPVYMAGPWRVAIVAAAQGPEIPGVGLDEKDGKEWVVVVADVTNWGSSSPAFPAEDVFVQMVEADTQHKVATGSTAVVGRELDLPEDPAGVNIDYGETGRVVMVFSVTADRTEPSLVFRDQLFPLDQMLLRDLEAEDLSEPAGPPELQEATLTAVATDGETLRVQYEGESKSRRIRLLGVDVTDSAGEAAEFLAEYEGETVYIEIDPAIDDTATQQVYLWVDNNRGDRVMLNQLLIEAGAAAYDPLPDDVRFALWFEVTATRAE